MKNKDTRRETPIVTSIIKWLNKIPGCYCEKRHGGAYQRSGNPDITGVYKGRRIEIEVKRPGENLRIKQKVILKRWKEFGCITGEARSIEDAEVIMKEHGVDI